MPTYAILTGGVVTLGTFVLGLFAAHRSSAETYYRLDTQAMFLAQTREVFQAAVETLTLAKGLRLQWRALHPDELKLRTAEPP